MAFAHHQHVRGPVVEQPHGPVQLPRRHRGLAGDHCGPVLLASEASADLLDENRNLVGLHPQRPGHGALVAVGVLRRAVDRHLVIHAGNGQGTHRLQIEVCLRPGPE